MANNIESEIKQWVTHVLLNQNINNPIITITGTSEVGDGFLGDITFVSSTGTRANVEQVEHDFVIKYGKRNNQIRDNFPVRSFFEREIFIYEEVLPTFQKLQEEKNITNKFSAYPKCYKTICSTNEEVLILENIKKRGYSLHDKNIPMNLKHLKLVFMEYAKFHALSFVLKDTKPELYKKLNSNYKIVLTHDVIEKAKINECAIQAFKESYSFFENSESDRKMLEKYRILEEQVPYIWGESPDEREDFSVISHGDCWNNNYMFKYDEHDKQQENPSAVAILDWQLSKLTSPVSDLSYFLYTNTSAAELAHYDELLSLYYSTLSEHMKKFDCDPNKLYPYEKYQEHWKKFGKCGFIFSFNVLKVCLSSKEEARNIAESFGSSTIGDALQFKSANDEVYRQRLRDVITHFVGTEFL